MMGDIHTEARNEIEKEQEAINNLIDSLMKFKPENLNSGAVKDKKINSSSPVSTRTRPSKQVVNKLSGNSLSAPSATSTILNGSSSPIDLVLECLNRLNVQNKNLITQVGELQQLIDKQNETIEVVKKDISNHNECKNCTPSAGAPSPIAINEVVARVEKLENKTNSLLLLCKGPEVVSRINTATVDNTVNLTLLKADICATICGNNISSIAVNSLGISLFGKNRNHIKIECSNNFVKDFILQQARIQKPTGVYVSEFLPYSKLGIFHNLLNLKKTLTNKIKAVYVRKGDIFCRVEPDIIVKISSREDLIKLNSTITDETANHDEPINLTPASGSPSIST